MMTATIFAAGRGGMADVLMAAVILGPILVATLFGITPRRWLPAVAWAGLAAIGAASAALAVLVGVGVPGLPSVGGWPAPLGIALIADGPAAVLIVMTACVMAAAGSYLLIEDGPHARSAPVWGSFFFLWAGLCTLFLTADLFNAYVALEITGLAGVALIVLSGTAKALTAQIRYLLIATGASLIYLMGVALIYAVTGRLDAAGMTPDMLMPNGGLAVVMVGLTLMTLGLLIKMAAWPVHGWLPPAHAGAIPPVSAILSALVVKAAAILLLRLWAGPFAPIVPPAAPVLIGLLGAGAILWGSVQALRQSHLKPIIAYSTVAQLGYLLVAVPIIAAGMAAGTPEVASEAWAGALIHAVSHGLAKAGLFLAAGSIVVAAGSDHLRVLLGASRTMPVAMMAIAVAGVSIMGLPPSAGFLGKWLMLRAAIGADAFFWALPIVGGGLLAAAYMFRILAFAFRPIPQGRAEPDPRLRRPGLEIVALIMGLLAVVVGLAGGGMIEMLSADPGWADSGMGPGAH